MFPCHCSFIGVFWGGASWSDLGTLSAPKDAWKTGCRPEPMYLAVCVASLVEISWDNLGRSQEQKNADIPMRKLLFRKLFFFGSWSLRWLCWAPLGASWASLGAKMVPIMPSKVIPEFVPKLV